MNIVKKIIAGSKHMFKTHQKSQALRVFVEMSDKQLADIGISRRLLQKGIGAYPWRETEVAEAPTAVQQPIAQILTFDKAATQAQGATPKLAA